VASLTVAVYVTLGGLISAVFNEVLQYLLIWFGSLSFDPDSWPD
jgi:solute:Na+ symporter, SSS family